MERAGRLAGSIGSRHVEFRDTRRRDGWPMRTDKVIMELALPGSTDELWARFDPKLRAQIRRANKEGVQIVRGRGELLPEFYAVFARNMRDLGTPVYAARFFAAILAAFPQAASIVLCRHRGRAVAGGFLLQHRERLEIPWAASVREYNRFGVNMALYWEALRTAIEASCRVFDFGRSTVDSGTYRFKKQWGASPRPLFWHYWLDAGVALPQLTPGNPKYRLAIAAWQRLPVFVANRLGPALVKHLP
jgi:FemAB-related protein (PEP-CTERM system-associated)